MEKCQLFEGYLQSIRATLHDSNRISFHADIGKNDPNCFNNHSTLIDYLRNVLLTICVSSRQYKFVIDFDTDNDAGTCIISSLLQLPQISRCLGVEIVLFDVNPVQLPVETIIAWLSRGPNELNYIGGIQKGWNLRFSCDSFHNLKEVIDILKKVTFISFLLKFYFQLSFTKIVSFRIYQLIFYKIWGKLQFNSP